MIEIGFILSSKTPKNNTQNLSYNDFHTLDTIKADK